MMLSCSLLILQGNKDRHSNEEVFQMANESYDPPEWAWPDEMGPSSRMVQVGLAGASPIRVRL